MPHVTLDITGTQFNWILGSLRLAARVAADAGGFGSQPENEVFTDGEGNTPTHSELEDLADAINAGEFSVVRQGCNVDADVIAVFDTLSVRVSGLHPWLHQQVKAVTNVLSVVFAMASDKLAANRLLTREAALVYAQAFADVATLIKKKIGGGDTPYAVIELPIPPQSGNPYNELPVVYAKTPVMAMYVRAKGGTEWVGVGGSTNAGIIVPAPSMAKFVNGTPVFQDLARALSKAGVSYELQPTARGWELRALGAVVDNHVPLGGGGDMPCVPDWPFCGLYTPVRLLSGSTAWVDAGAVHESQL